MTAQTASIRKRAGALVVATGLALGVVVLAWLIGDRAGLGIDDVVRPALIGGLIGLMIAIAGIALAVSRFRDRLSRLTTPSALLLGGLGLWAYLIVPARTLIGLVVALGSALFFFVVLAALLDPWYSRRIEKKGR